MNPFIPSYLPFSVRKPLATAAFLSAFHGDLDQLISTPSRVLTVSFFFFKFTGSTLSSVIGIHERAFGLLQGGPFCDAGVGDLFIERSQTQTKWALQPMSCTQRSPKTLKRISLQSYRWRLGLGESPGESDGDTWNCMWWWLMSLLVYTPQRKLGEDSAVCRIGRQDDPWSAASVWTWEWSPTSLWGHTFGFPALVKAEKKSRFQGILAIQLL